MGIKFVADCLTAEQKRVCADAGIELVEKYARSFGEITTGCVTDFSVHCFNSDALLVLAEMGVNRATLHPELNLAQIRDIKKCIPTEVLIYGKIPLMKLGIPLTAGELTDRKGTKFFSHGDNLYNSVPLFMADKLKALEKAGVAYGRLLFTTESVNEVQAVIKAYKHQKKLEIEFTRGKYFSKV